MIFWIILSVVGSVFTLGLYVGVLVRPVLLAWRGLRGTEGRWNPPAGGGGNA